LSAFVPKLGAFANYLLLSVIAAGLFGALHDQISYTVSPEYFTKFKFVQFAWLGSTLPARVRAAEIGFLASWWMGIPLGLLTGLAGFIHADAARMRRALLLSLPVITGFTLLFALTGLILGFLKTAELDLADYPERFIPPDLDEPRRFICAGTMHNFAYLGGALSIPLAWIFHIAWRLRCRAGH
jgi:hypothetical protein